MAITGFPLPYFATNAVGIPATPFSTRKPLLSRYDISSRLDLYSCRASSAALQIFMLTLRIASAFASSQRKAASLSASGAAGADTVVGLSRTSAKQVHASRIRRDMRASSPACWKFLGFRAMLGQGLHQVNGRRAGAPHADLTTVAV